MRKKYLHLTLIVFILYASALTAYAADSGNSAGLHPEIGTATLVGTINVAALEQSALPSYSMPRDLTAVLTNSVNNVVTQNPPSNMTNGSLQIESVIEGINEQTCQCSVPSPQIAAGPNHVMEITSYYVQIFSKNGNLISSFPLANLFKTTNFQIYDARLLYDEMSARWFAVGLYSEIPYIAVSTSNDPTGDWNVYNTNFSNFDHTSIGTSDDKFIMLAGNGSVNAYQAIIYDKAALVAGSSSAAWQLYNADTSYREIHPVQALGSTSTAYMVSVTTDYNTDGYYFANLFSIKGTVPNANVSVVTLPLQVPPYPVGQTIALTGMQPGTGYIGIDEGYIESASWYNGKLWLADNAICMPTGDTSYRSCPLLVQIDTNTNSVLQDFFFGSIGYYFYFPAVSIDKLGNLVVVFGYSSTTAYPSLAVTGQLANAQPGTLSPFINIKSGSADSPGSAYGGWFGAGRDPSDQTLVWVAGEYQPTSNFSTVIASVRTPTSNTLEASETGTASGFEISHDAQYDGISGYTTSAGYTVSEIDFNVDYIVGNLTGYTMAVNVWTDNNGNLGTSICRGTIAGSAIVPGWNAITNLAGSCALAANTNYDITLDEGADYAASSAVVYRSVMGAQTIPGKDARWFSSKALYDTSNYDVMDFKIWGSTSSSIQTYTLTTTTSGTGSGTVTNNPPGTTFNAGTQVTLTATANTGSTFAGWSGACSGTSPTCTLTMNSNNTVNAAFTANSSSNTLEASETGTASGFEISHDAQYDGISGYTTSAGYTVGEIDFNVDYIVGNLSGYTMAVNVWTDNNGNLGTSICRGTIAGSAIVPGWNAITNLTGSCALAANTNYDITLDEGADYVASSAIVYRSATGGQTISGQDARWFSNKALYDTSDNAMDLKIWGR